jgi:hypothetical protein
MRSYAVTSLFVGALAVFVLALLEDRGDLVFVAFGLVTFAAGFAVGLIPSAVLRLSMLITGPLTAWIIYRAVNPEPDCTSDCVGQLIWGILLLMAAGGWCAGLVIATLCSWLMERANRG